MFKHPIVRVGILVSPFIVSGALYFGYPAIQSSGIVPIEYWVRAAARSLSGDLPRRIQSNMIWESVVADGQMAVFTYRIEMGEIPNGMRTFIADAKRSVPQEVCSIRSLRPVIRLGAQFRFEFRNARNQSLGFVDLDASSCDA
jgi:hypothetical protein